MIRFLNRTFYGKIAFNSMKIFSVINSIESLAENLNIYSERAENSASGSILLIFLNEFYILQNSLNM